MEKHVFETFRRTVCSLTGDPQVQKDLMQEMYVHLLDLRASLPSLTQREYIRSCEQHAHGYFTRLRAGESAAGLIEPVAVRQEEWLTGQQIETLRPRLSARQQAVMEHLQKGCGVRETARQLGISHPAVIKHRRTITRLAACL